MLSNPFLKLSNYCAKLWKVKGQNLSQLNVATECRNCEQQINVPLTAKCFTCPKCGDHVEFDAGEMYENYKLIMKRVYGEKPDKPQNN